MPRAGRVCSGIKSRTLVGTGIQKDQTPYWYLDIIVDRRGRGDSSGAGKQRVEDRGPIPE